MANEDRERLVVDPGVAAQPEVGRWMWALNDARERTKEDLAGIDQSTLDWAAGPDGNSIGTLLYHLAAIEADWLYVEVLEQPVPTDLFALWPPEVRDGSGHLTAVKGKSLSDLLSILDEVHARVQDVFSRMSVEEFRRERHLPAYDVTPEWVLYHLSQHEAQHRGEMLLLREQAEAASKR